jgi:cytochrome c oxidase assembly factor CtaG
VLSCALAVPGCPSTTVFVAAGALRLHLAPLAAGFAAGRAAWYTGAVIIAGTAASGIESLVRRGLNPWLIALAFVLVIAPLFVLSRIEWRALLQERRIRFIPRRPPGSDSGGAGE